MAVGKCVGAGILFIIVIVIMLVAGCSSTQYVPDQNVSPTTSVATAEDVAPKVSLQQTFDALNASSNAGIMNGGVSQICYIRGADISMNGTAGEWILGVNCGNASYFFVFSPRGESVVPWPDSFPYQEINCSQIMMPQELLTTHTLLAQDLTKMGSTDMSELVLLNGMYTLSTQSNGNFTLDTFDATTGKEIV